MIPLQDPAAVMIALDIDGTLVAPGSSHVSVLVVDAVERVRAAGHHVVLASGRSLVGVLPIARALGLTSGWVVASNGAVAARLSGEVHRVAKSLTFNPGPVIAAVQRELPGVQIGVERVGWGWDVTRLFAGHEVNGAQKHASSAALAARPTPRMILRAPDVLKVLDLVSGLGVAATPAAADWIDVIPRGLSKAVALDEIREHEGVHPSRTLAVGDGLNDVEMLRWARRGVAMGHAPRHVRDIADDVVGSFADGGVLHVLNQLATPAAPIVGDA